ncbi:MAG: potassium channel family protein [Candidatus Hodarchaeales archaeon]
MRKLSSILLAFKQLRNAIFLLCGTIIIGTLIFQLYYNTTFDPLYTGNIIDDIIATIALLLSLDVYSFPHGGSFLLKGYYVVYPFIGYVLIGIGLLEFGSIVFTYRYRLEAWNQWLAKDMENHTILVGLGNVGSRILSELKEDNIPTTVITMQDADSSEYLQNLLDDNTIAIVFGDATQQSVLLKANVKKARALLSVSNDDLVNFKIATIAKELNPNLRTVIRAFDTAFSEKVTELFDIDAAISTSAIAAPAFVATSFEDGIIQTLKSKKGGTEMHLMEVNFTHGELPTTVQLLERTFDITILAINKQAHPELSDKIEKESKLLVLGEIDVLRQLKRAYSQ